MTFGMPWWHSLPGISEYASSVKFDKESIFPSRNYYPPKESMGRSPSRILFLGKENTPATFPGCSLQFYFTGSGTS
jgi:hypothetical protein